MKKTLAMLLTLIMTMSLVACGAQNSPAAGTSSAPVTSAATTSEPIVMMMGSTIAETSAQGMGMLKFEELVEERSNGRIDVQLYLNSTMGDARQLCESIQMHTIQSCVTGGSDASNFDGNYMACDMPFLFLSYEDAYAALDGEWGEYLAKSSEENGMKVLGFWDNGFRNISNDTKPIETPADMAGMKIRVMEAPLYVNVMKAFGANPTPMAFSEVYTALQQGTVDGQDNGPVLTYTNKFYEVQDYYTVLEYAYAMSPVMVDATWFDTLDADLQQIIIDAEKECREYEREVQQQLCTEYLQLMVDAGMNVNYLDESQKQAFRDLAIPVWDVAEESIDPEFFAMCKELASA